MEHTLKASRPVLGEWAANALVLLVTLAVAWGAAEAYISWKIDDGMQFDLEMWRYAFDSAVYLFGDRDIEPGDQDAVAAQPSRRSHAASSRSSCTTRSWR